MDIDLKFVRASIVRSLYFARGRATFNYLRELERNQWLSTKDIEQIQWVNQKNLLDYVYLQKKLGYLLILL